MFLKNCWYVAAWSQEIEPDAIIGRKIIGERVALYRSAGVVHAVADHCPHRRAPLSLGRVEGGHLRCMYHGLLFDGDGQCILVPGSDIVPPNSSLRTYPVVERDSWIWVWMGDPDRADLSLIPAAFGLDDKRWTMRADQIDYSANYMLINDNLLDLSHVDFTHERTLGAATGYGWSDDQPKVIPRSRSIHVERWLVGRPQSPKNPALVDTWSTYDYSVPGVFVMENKSYPHGMAEQCGYGVPSAKPMAYRVEQQAVTPMSDRETRYFFATGFDAGNLPQKLIDGIFETVMLAFREDREIIEAQQQVWDDTPEERPMAFIPSDKAPMMMRRLIARLIREEDAPQIQDA